MKKLVKFIFFLAAAAFLMLIEDWYQVHNSATLQDLSLQIPSTTSWPQPRQPSVLGPSRGEVATPVSADLGT